MRSSFRNAVLAMSLAGFLVSCGPGGEKPAPEIEASSVPDLTTPDPARAVAWTTKSLPEITEALKAGEFTSEELVLAYLERVDAIDQSGPELNSIIALNPNAVMAARAIDARRADDEDVGPLQGAPILIKDNIGTGDPIPTTGGSLALAENYTDDAELVTNIRKNGGVILGKTNLSEWANFRAFRSQSGWSGVLGRTKNPHVLDHQTCGSSAGSGAATAASLAAGSVGTETNGSVICPSSANGVVGFKPSIGVVGAYGIIPGAPSQDTAGPMTRTVYGAALLLNAMSGDGVDYTAGLSKDALQGKRIGVMRFAQNDQAELNALFEQALDVLEAQGAVLVDIDEFTPDLDDFSNKSRNVVFYELKHALDEYLAATPDTVKVKSLADVIAFNEEHADEELQVFDQAYFIAAEAAAQGITEAQHLETRAAINKATGEEGIEFLLSEYGVDALVMPSTPVMPVIVPGGPDNWPNSWAGASFLAAISGSPHISVPMGAVDHVPVGFSIVSAKGRDADVLALGYAYEQASLARPEPGFIPSLASAEDE